MIGNTPPTIRTKNPLIKLSEKISTNRIYYPKKVDAITDISDKLFKQMCIQHFTSDELLKYLYVCFKYKIITLKEGFIPIFPEEKKGASSQLKEEKTLDCEQQKKLVSFYLTKLHKDYPNLEIERYELNLFSLCQLMLIKLSTSILQRCQSSNMRGEFYSILFQVFQTALWGNSNTLQHKLEPWMRKNLTPPDYKEFIKPLSLIGSIGLQEGCLDITPRELGIDKDFNCDPLITLNALFNLQYDLFLDINPIMKKMEESIERVLQAVHTDFNKYNKFEIFSRSILKNLDSRFYYYLTEKLSSFQNYNKLKLSQILVNSHLIKLSFEKSPSALLIDQFLLEMKKLRQIQQNTFEFISYFENLADYFGTVYVNSRIMTQEYLEKAKPVYDGNCLLNYRFFKELECVLKKITSEFQIIEPKENDKSTKEIFLTNHNFYDLIIYFLKFKISNSENIYDKLITKYQRFPNWYQEFLKLVIPKLDDISELIIEEKIENYEIWKARFPFLNPKGAKKKRKLGNSILKLIKFHCEQRKQANKCRTSTSPSDFLDMLHNDIGMAAIVILEMIKMGEKFKESVENQTNDHFKKYKSYAGDFYLNPILKAKAALTNFHSYLSINLDILFPLIQNVREKTGLLQSEQIVLDNQWLFSIDPPRKRNKRIKKKQVVEKPSLKEPKKIQAKATPSLLRTPQESFIICQNDPVSQLNEALIGKLVIPPHRIFHSKEISDEKLFQMEQAYQFNHFYWILESMEKALSRGDFRHIPLLGSLLIESLYLTQEQLITPQYYSTYNRVDHGLLFISGQLGIKCQEAFDQGSIWYRYPSSSKAFYEGLNKEIPLGLQLIIDFTQTDNLEFRKSIKNIVFATKIGLNYIFERLKEQKILEESLSLLQGSFEKRLSLIEQQLHCIPSEKEVEISRVGEANKLNECIIQMESLKKNGDPLFPCEDLIIHLKRLLQGIDLVNDFPEPHFLSLHTRHFWKTSQYILELYLETIAQLENDSLHTHDLERYRVILGLCLSETNQQFLNKLNLKKGTDYIYWESYKNQGMHAKKLQVLSEAYEISLVDTLQGENFVPSSQTHFSIEPKIKALLGLVDSNLAVIEELRDRLVIKG